METFDSICYSEKYGRVFMRLYQKQYQIIDPLEALPRPGELVEEIQSAPYYRIDENMRNSFSGGQFSLTLEGEGVFQCGDERTLLKPGDGFLALHGERDVSYYFPPEGKAPWVFLWISFMGEGSERSIREMNERYGNIYHIDINGRLVSELRTIVRWPGVVFPMEIGKGAEMSSRILGTLLDSKSPPSDENSENALTTRFQEYVLENVRRDFGVGDVADALSISREHLSRVIMRKMGISPAVYIREKRMREARHLLLETNMTCSDISKTLGFSTSASFSRSFKSVTGTTPDRYRFKR
jgi:AraC-like DNA-binding protein